MEHSLTQHSLTQHSLTQATATRVAAVPSAPARVIGGEDADYVVRFDVHQRVQHILMFTSFLVLAFTGLPQKFFTLEISRWIIASLGGLEMTQAIHHAAGYVMLFDCVYHGLYLFYSLVIRRRTRMLQMIPTPRDFLDIIQHFLYFLGFTTQRPRFRRFSYLEKFDYFAVSWGIVVIGGSGVVLMFPVTVSRLIGGAIVPVAHAAHSDEAVLAVAWIFLVHLFYAHLAPNVFPMNTSIFTGRVSRERYQEEHPLAPEFAPAAEGEANPLRLIPWLGGRWG